MIEFISELPSKILQLKQSPEIPVRLVLGNESCDLDSAICAITLAHHLHSKNEDRTLVLPVLNIPQEDVPLRTEVEFCIGKELLCKVPTRDDIDFAALTNVQVILVDHHKLIEELEFLSDKVTQIIDHRQEDASAKIPDDCKKTIQLVGSCATLVTLELLKNGYKDSMGLALLRDTIIVDTVNLSPKAKKATDLDSAQLNQIDKVLGLKEVFRSQRLKLVSKAKGSIEGFTVDQMLRKDLKMIVFKNGIRAAVPSTLKLSYDLCRSEDHIEKIFEKFCQKYKVPLLIIIAHNAGRRDILLFHPASADQVDKTVDKIVNALCAHEETQITKTPTNHKIVPDHAVHLAQGNVTFSRKKLLPIILGAIE